MVRDFAEIPDGADRVIFFPPARAAARRDARTVRAEARARELLRSVAGDEAAAMYEQLGFVAFEDERRASYGYLHLPAPADRRLRRAQRRAAERVLRPLPGRRRAEAGEWLPDADDVLAKWMALRADERSLIGTANLHLPGRQLDPAMVRRDLATAAGAGERRR